MAFDACIMRAVISEIRNGFSNAKIEKVLQPQNDEIDLVIHANRTSKRLIFNVGPNAPRLQLSDAVKENPKVPPMFCMLLRKRLGGARLTSVRQEGFDRIARFTFTGYDDMGYPTDLSLICEIMGKYANLILTDGEDKIIAALKTIDFSASTVRQVLPGLRYTLPTPQNKMSPLVKDRAFFFEKLAEFPSEKTVERFITETWCGIATQVAHELCHRATGRIDARVGEVSADALCAVFEAWQGLLLSESYTPSIVFDLNGKPKDYCYMPLTYLGDAVTYATYADFGALFDLYFAERDRLEQIHRRAHDLLQLLANAEGRTQKKLALQRQALADSERAEIYKRSGDLITENLYRLKRGMREFVAIDYYDDACPEVVVQLDPMKTPSQNAQRMYKLYNKCKTAKEVLTRCIAEWEAELLYLDSVRDFLLRAECEQDMIDLRDELFRSGYASKMKGYRPQKTAALKPIELRTSGGYRLLVGRNNIQNDHLTFKVASKGDLWFHVKDMPGSHVILMCDGEEPSEADYTEAAAIAAGHSKATAAPVAVDYTRVKNIRKPAGAKPGYVIYKTNFTAFVEPAKKLPL